MLQSDIEIFKEGAILAREIEYQKQWSSMSGSKYMIAAVSQLEAEGKVEAGYFGDTVSWRLVDNDI